MTDARAGRAFVKGLFGGALIGAVGGWFFAPEISAALKNLPGDAVGDLPGANDAKERAREAQVELGQNDANAGQRPTL
jgi:hypothetical protein